MQGRDQLPKESRAAASPAHSCSHPELSSRSLANLWASGESLGRTVATALKLASYKNVPLAHLLGGVTLLFLTQRKRKQKGDRESSLSSASKLAASFPVQREEKVCMGSALQSRLLERVSSYFAHFHLSDSSGSLQSRAAALSRTAT